MVSSDTLRLFYFSPSLIALPPLFPANKDGFLTYTDFHACPAMWDYLISMGFDNNHDLRISPNEFGAKFIELALKDSMPISGFGGTGLELYEAFMTELTEKVKVQVNHLDAVIDGIASAMEARSQEIARAAFHQSAAMAFRPTQFAATNFEQHQSSIGTFPGI
jgi:hypothetical protein